MALPVAVSDLNAFTRIELVPRCTEVVYKKSPLLQRILTKGNVRVNYDGGMKIQRPIQYAKLNGGWFTKADSFNTAYVQTETAIQVNMKFAYVNISLHREDGALNRGKNAVFSQVELKMANAAMRMAEIQAGGLFGDGQTSDADVITSSGVLTSTSAFDGLLAYIDDGNNYGSYTTATDVTKSFTELGGITRANLFVSAPVFSGATTPTGGVSQLNSYVDRNFATFTLNGINLASGYSTYGNETVDMIVTTQNAWNKFWNALQPQQRFQEKDSDVGKIGFKSFRFNGIEVVVDQYCPAQLALGINSNYLEMYVSEDPLFQYGFTGFKESVDNLKISGQFVFAGNLVHASPRHCFKLVGSALA